MMGVVLGFDSPSRPPERIIELGLRLFLAKLLLYGPDSEWVPNSLSEQPRRKPVVRDCFRLRADRVR